MIGDEYRDFGPDQSAFEIVWALIEIAAISAVFIAALS